MCSFLDGTNYIGKGKGLSPVYCPPDIKVLCDWPDGCPLFDLFCSDRQSESEPDTHRLVGFNRRLVVALVEKDLRSE